jgi:hypothetical protein
VSVYIPETTEPIRGGAEPTKVRQENATVVSNHDILYRAFAIDEHADLPARFLRQFAEIPCQFMGDDLLGGHLPPVYMLNAPHLIGFQPYNIAVYTLNRHSSSVSAYPVPAVAGATHAPATSRATSTTGTEDIET